MQSNPTAGKKIKVMSIFGTRPEAIKLAPVIRAMSQDPNIDSRVVVTGQHRQMLDQVLDVFKIRPDHDLNVMAPNQTLAKLTSRVIDGLDPLVAAEKPDYVLVQGDTTTVFCASLVAFYHKVRVGHVEAGLRTHERYSPFPEEMNRKLTASLADLHFAPTERSRQNLLREGFDPSTVHVTMNTVIDALLYITSQDRPLPPSLSKIDFSKKVVVVTLHRRENQGDPMARIAGALKELAQMHPEIEIVVPLHLSPAVQTVVQPILQGAPNIQVISPLDYLEFTDLLKRCYMILTDSGGIQEEAPSLGKPVLVLRESTERPEGVEAGVNFLVGADPRRILELSERFLTDQAYYQSVAQKKNPFGDGKASERIIELLKTQI